MPTLKDVFDMLGENIKEQVEEVDKLGYADKFKSATEILIKQLEDTNYHPLHWGTQEKITVKDLRYLDGYFIFGFGTNSVIEFHVEECPGWLFGVWWDVVDEENDDYSEEHIKNNVSVSGQFFCQYESNIDKFKPSASVITDTFEVNVDNESSSIYGVKEIITFIIKQPHLAFCRDYLYWNYNTEYHSPREAKWEFNKYLKQKATEEKTKLKNDIIVLGWVKKNILSTLKDLKNVELVDKGDNWHPRYDIYIPYEENKDKLMVDGPGCYDWFGNEDEPLNKEWRALIDRLRKKALKKGVYWHSPVDDSFEVYNKNK